MTPAPASCGCGDCRACRQREASTRWRERNRKAARAADRAWRQSAAGKLWERERRKRDRIKVAARRAVNNAIRDGKLKKGACERLGPACKGRVEGHHEDYSRPLEIRWLCGHHHREVEREEQDEVHAHRNRGRSTGGGREAA